MFEFVSTKMKIVFILVSLFVFSFFGLGNGHDDERSFGLAEVFGNATIGVCPSEELVPACFAVVLAPNEVLIVDDDECLKLNPAEMMVMYKCHNLDENNRVTSEYGYWGAYVESAIRDNRSRTMRVKTGDQPKHCVIFTTAEALNAYSQANFTANSYAM